MKYLLINQHTSNHGDEAAGKSILRNLSNVKNISISVLYNTLHKLSENELFNIENIKITHYETGGIKLNDKILIYLTFIVPFSIITKFYFLSQKLSKELDIIKSSDRIINGPGGVNIGPYKDWKYIWRLYVSLKLNKPLAIYSISFGPIPEEKIFQRVSIYILKNATFLSLRDKKSQEYSKTLNLNSIDSIDTAFLNKYVIDTLPKELLYLDTMEYVVIVPNQLYKWHPNFKPFSDEIIDTFYVEIIERFLKENINVILLPQLYGGGNDVDYFKVIKNKVNDNSNLYIVDEKYNSDIQQCIIRKSNFLVGARYHSIIFAINNNIPLYCLSYEHKMENTLEILSLKQYSKDLIDIFENKIDILDDIMQTYHNRNSIKDDIQSASFQAKNIALNTYKKLLDQFLND